MVVDVVTEVVIDRPCGVVAGYAGDPSKATQWYANIDSVDWRTPPPVQVGSTMDFVARFFGRRLAYTYEVVEYVPGARLVMRTAQGPFPMETTYTWQAIDAERTRMSLLAAGSRDDAYVPAPEDVMRGTDEVAGEQSSRVPAGVGEPPRNQANCTYLGRAPVPAMGLKHCSQRDRV